MMGEQISDGLHELAFNFEVGERYHRRRQAFFNRLSTALQFIVVFAALAMGGTYLADAPHWLPATSALLVAAATTIQIVCGLSKGEAAAARLADRYRENAEALAAGVRDEAALVHFRGRRAELEKQEGCTLRVLTVLCRNEAILALGYDPQELKPLTFTQRLLAHLCDVGESSFKRAAPA